MQLPNQAIMSQQLILPWKLCESHGCCLRIVESSGILGVSRVFTEWCRKLKTSRPDDVSPDLF